MSYLAIKGSAPWFHVGGWFLPVALSLCCGLSLKSFALATPAEPKPLIQIGVEVVEVDEQKTEQLGIQWLNILHLQEASIPSLFNVGTLARTAIFADLQFLEQHGAADLLANPKLVARDGSSASFHAGGELPYATAASLGTVTVEFKPYGVSLKISPHVNEQGQIEMSVDAEVSGPDPQNGVSLSGNIVPGIRSRQVSSQLTLAPGSTLTMAGMIQNDKEWVRTGVPGLMRVPVLKYLVSSKTQVNRRTSIVVFVTPTILSPDPSATRKATFNALSSTPPAPASRLAAPWQEDDDLPSLTGNEPSPARGIHTSPDGGFHG